MTTPKRRLPVIARSEDDDEPPKPAWQWVLFGSVMMLALWIPGAAAVSSLTMRTGLAETHGGLSALVHCAVLAISAACCGYLVGRYGPRASNRFSLGAVAALIPALAATALMFRYDGALQVAWALLIVPLLATGFGALGARMGTRRR